MLQEAGQPDNPPSIEASKKKPAFEIIGADRPGCIPLKIPYIRRAPLGIQQEKLANFYRAEAEFLSALPLIVKDPPLQAETLEEAGKLINDYLIDLSSSEIAEVVQANFGIGQPSAIPTSQISIPDLGTPKYPQLIFDCKRTLLQTLWLRHHQEFTELAKEFNSNAPDILKQRYVLEAAANQTEPGTRIDGLYQRAKNNLHFYEDRLAIRAHAGEVLDLYLLMYPQERHGKEGSASDNIEMFKKFYALGEYADTATYRRYERSGAFSLTDQPDSSTTPLTPQEIRARSNRLEIALARGRAAHDVLMSEKRTWSLKKGEPEYDNGKAYELFVKKYQRSRFAACKKILTNPTNQAMLATRLHDYLTAYHTSDSTIIDLAVPDLTRHDLGKILRILHTIIRTTPGGPQLRINKGDLTAAGIDQFIPIIDTDGNRKLPEPIMEIITDWAQNKPNLQVLKELTEKYGQKVEDITDLTLTGLSMTLQTMFMGPKEV